MSALRRLRMLTIDTVLFYTHTDIILSAAHCDEISSNTVYVGSSRRLAADEAGGRGQQRSITQRITHPSYNAITTDFDYLIMKLDLPVDTQPALLNENPNIPNEAEVLTVIGYGATVEGGSGSSTLQEVAVNYIPAEKCNIDYNGHINGATMMCAGVGGGKDSCQGDSGGPIVIEAGDTFIQVGIVSWGEGCARPDFPGVYSRVSGQIEWIKAQICKLSDEPPDYCKMASIGPAASPTGSVSSPPTASGTAAPAPSPSTISPTISSPSASASLSSAPVGASPTAEICVDTAGTFTVDDIHQQKDCAWLAENKSKFGYLCQFVDVAAACKKTCNVCDFFYPSSLVQSSARLGSGLFGKFAGKVVGGVAGEVGSQMSSSDSQTSSSNSTTSSSDSNAGKIVGPIIAFLVILCIVCICRRARKPES
jgi:secreted trypsin-like serine protease